MWRRRMRDNEAMAMRLAALAELPGVDIVLDGPGARARRERAMFFGVAFAPIEISSPDQRPSRMRRLRPWLVGCVPAPLRRSIEQIFVGSTRRPAPRLSGA